MLKRFLDLSCAASLLPGFLGLYFVEFGSGAVRDAG